MGSGAGLNRVFKTILTVPTNATAMDGSTTPLTPLLSYGTLGINDSKMVLNEAMNFTKWTFSMNPADDYTIMLYGTNDLVAVQAWTQGNNPGAYPAGAVTLPATSWFILPAPSEQAGTGAIGNPLTKATPVLIVSMPLLAVRAVVTAVGSPAASAAVSVQAVP